MTTYSIAELSNMLHLTASTLRYYEEIGLLPPVERSSSKQRIYTNAHIDRIHAIICFKNTGMSISDIQKFFTYESDELAHIHDMLDLLDSYQRDTLYKLQEEIKAYAHLLRKIDFYHEIAASFDQHTAHPKWEDYDDRDYLQQAKQDLELSLS